MKKFYQTTLVISLLLLGNNLFAQDAADTTATGADTVKIWDIGGLISLNFNQSTFTNWAAGGDNTVGLSLFYKPFFNYNKGRVSWENKMDFRYGKNKIASDPWRKTNDLIDINSKLGIEAGKNWFYTTEANFRTQFDEGFEKNNRNNYISKFMAPAYFALALGMDYKPNKHLSLFLSPLTTRTTFVLDDSLSNAGAFGVDPGEKSFTQMGPSAVFNYKKEIFENVLLDTEAAALYEYHSDPKFVFTWDLVLTMKVNKFLATTITTGLIYDENILFDVTDDTGVVVDREKRVQFRESLEIGLTFTY